MSNANTIRRQVAGSQALTLAPISNLVATETNFVLNANGAIPSNPYAGEASPILSGGVIPLVAGATGLWLGTGAVMHIRATGTWVASDSSSGSLYQIVAGSCLCCSSGRPDADFADQFRRVGGHD